jgi:hypothetical protein
MRCLRSKLIAAPIKASTSERVLLALLEFIFVVFVCDVYRGLRLCLKRQRLLMIAVAIATTSVREYVLLYVIPLVDALCPTVLARCGSGIGSMASRGFVAVRNRCWCDGKSRALCK